MVLAWTQGKMGGTILGEEMRAKGPVYLAVEFYGPEKSKQGHPMISMQYTVAPVLAQAQAFLRDEKVEYRSCDGQIMTAILEHLKSNTDCSNPLTDILSGRPLYESSMPHISPTKMLKFTANAKAPAGAAPNSYAPTDVNGFAAATAAAGNLHSMTMTAGSSGFQSKNISKEDIEAAAKGKCPICFTVSCKKCEACKAVYYCSVDHQRQVFRYV
jgi:hypothetical protein